jgi:dienelactone hydrolase
LGPATVSADRRTVRLTIEAEEPPEASDLAVVLSGEILDATTQPSTPSVPYVAPEAGRRLEVDPGVPGPHRVVTEDYRLPSIKIPGLPARVEMVGHVERPADTSARHPLVLFLYGRHSYCYRTSRARGPGRRAGWPCPRGTSPVPSQLGYRYVQRLLASQGYVTVSIAANGVNAQDYRLVDGGAEARAELVRAHLAQWVRWATTGRYAVDMQRVVLVGHSRGGEGVDRVSVETPLSAPYRIRGQVLIAPTAAARQVAAYVPTVTLLPYCDGDVSNLEGQAYTDVARDAAPDDNALHSSVLVMGANHNFFNTEWTPGLSHAPSFDDARSLAEACRRGGRMRLTPVRQRAVAKAYLAGAVRLMVAGDQRFLPMFDGSDVEIPSADGADVRSATVGLGRAVRRPGIDARLGASTGTTAQLCVGKAGAGGTALCGAGLSSARTPHWIASTPYTRGVPTQRAMQVAWTHPGGSASLRLDRPLDLSTAPRLDLRTVVDPRRGPVRLRVRLHDASGNSAVLTPDGGGLLVPLPGPDPLGKLWGQPLRVPLGDVVGLDLTDITQVDLLAASSRGRIWVLDLAGTTPTMPPVTDRRLARVDLGDARVVEGNQTSDRIAHVPFRVAGTASVPVSFAVTARNVSTGGTLPPQTIHLVAGQTAGSIEIPVLPDRHDDLPVQRIEVAAYALQGAMTARYISTLRILDDDPPPRVVVRTAARTVREGQRARWVVRLSRPTDYYPLLRGRVVRGHASLPPARVGDVPRRWLRDQVEPVPDASTPLYRARLRLGVTVRPGQRRAVLSVPLRADGLPEGREMLTMQVWLAGVSDPVQRTVVIEDR